MATGRSKSVGKGVSSELMSDSDVQGSGVVVDDKPLAAEPIVNISAQKIDTSVSRVLDALELKAVEIETRVDKLESLIGRIEAVEKRCGIGVVVQPYEQRTTLPDGIPSGSDIIDDAEMQKHILRR
jgi:hypothetical protein